MGRISEDGDFLCRLVPERDRLVLCPPGLSPIGLRCYAIQEVSQGRKRFALDRGVNALRRNLPNVTGVYVPLSTVGALMAVVQMKKTAEGQPKQAIMAALGTEF